MRSTNTLHRYTVLQISKQKAQMNLENKYTLVFELQ